MAFVNESISKGIENYLLKKDGKDIESSRLFECEIIKMLCYIYGEANIINPYKVNKQGVFLSNLCIYGLTSMDANLFVDLVDTYNYWLSSSIESENSLFKDISKILIKMIVLKKFYKKITTEELEYYDNFFLLKDYKISGIASLLAKDNEDLKQYWQRKRRAYLGDIDLEIDELEPLYLDEKLYNKYGLSMDDIRKLGNIRVKEINNEIMKEEAKNSDGGGRGKEKPKQLVLTSGNGFVDMLVLLSIMMTEIMLGFVIAVCGGR